MKLVVAFLVGTACIAGTTVATHDCQPGDILQSVTVPLGTLDGTARYYVHERDLFTNEFVFSVWIYQETNHDLTGDLYGLQRGGAVWWDPTSTDPCQDKLASGTLHPDTAWF